MNPFGTVAPPPGVNQFGGGLSGLPLFINVIFKTLVVGAGVYSVINFLFAGYTFLSGAGDPKKIGDAWAKIWQTMLGLAIAAAAVLIGAILGIILFKDANAIIQIRVFGP